MTDSITDKTRYDRTMTRIAQILSGLIVLAIFISGCENTFEPKAEFREELVIYSVFSKAEAEQVVRLESTFDAEFVNPDAPLAKRIITDADVFVRDNHTETEYKFIKRQVNKPEEAERYIWVSSELVPAESHHYRLRVVMGGTTVATAEMQQPSGPFLLVTFSSAGSGGGGVHVGAGGISTAAPPKGFYFRLFVRGEVFEGGNTSIVTEEVPYTFNPALGESGQFVFTTPGRADVVVFPTGNIARVKDKLINEYGATNITLRAFGYSMEKHFYNYYKVVRGFEDPVSIRQDQPNITNVSGGLGVFGGMTLQVKDKPYFGFIR
jgi:Domain of unknown function (DUF4249)